MTSVATANVSLKNMSVMGCHTSKRTSAAGKPAANKKIEIKARVFPAIGLLLVFLKPSKFFCFIGTHFIDNLTSSFS